MTEIHWCVSTYLNTKTVTSFAFFWNILKFRRTQEEIIIIRIVYRTRYTCPWQKVVIYSPPLSNGSCWRPNRFVGISRCIISNFYSSGARTGGNTVDVYYMVMPSIVEIWQIWITKRGQLGADCVQLVIVMWKNNSFEIVWVTLTVLLTAARSLGLLQLR